MAVPGRMTLPPVDIAWSAALHAVANRFGAMPAFNDGQCCLSYTDLCARAHGLAARMVSRGVGHGAEVASLLPNGLIAAWVAYGMKISGVAEIPLNFGYTSQEIEWGAKVAGFRLVVTTRQRAPQIQALGLDVLLVEEIGECEAGFLCEPVPVNTPGRILFTSGTTGFPKAAVYTHGRRWAGEQLLKATLPFIPQRGERILLMTPFTHGASLLAFAWCDYGGEVLLLDGVQTDTVLEALASGSVSAIFAPPTILAKLALVLGRRRFDGVRCVFTGTQPLTAAQYDVAAEMFGPVVRVTFGKTECVNPITVLDAHESQQLYAASVAGPGTCVGWPAPGVELRIEYGASEAASGGPREGEVWLRGQQMSDGMLDIDGFRPHEPQGWHRTGDQGYMDQQGRLWLTGRLADVIKTGGYRVNPDEVEWALNDDQDCRIVVTSVSSDYWGEVIVAVAQSPDSDWESRARTRAQSLSRHKQPRAYVVVQQFPSNAQGKISRRKLSALVLETHFYIDGPYPELSPASPAQH